MELLGNILWVGFLTGVAEAGAWSSILTIIAAVFQDRVTSVYSLTQGAFGFAEILGPSVGGILFEVCVVNKIIQQSTCKLQMYMFVSGW